MKRVKQCIAFLLTLMLMMSTLMGNVIPVPVEASLLQLEEKNATLTIQGSPKELQNMPVKTALAQLKDESGNFIDLSGKTSVWAKSSGNSSSRNLLDEYHAITDEEKMDFTELVGNDYSGSTTMTGTVEFIIGSGKQLDSSNIRYITTVTVKYTNIREYELYLYQDKGTGDARNRSKVSYTEGGSYWYTYTPYGEKITKKDYNVSVKEGYYPNLYAGLMEKGKTAWEDGVKIYSMWDYLWNHDSAEEITSEIIGASESAVGSGRSIGSSLSLAIVYPSENGVSEVQYVEFYVSGVHTDRVAVDDTIYDGNGSSVGYCYTSTVSTNREEYIYNLYTANESNAYVIKATAYISDGGKGTGEVEKSVSGFYDSLEEAQNETDITASLFDTSGYSIDLSNKQSFTVFFKNTVTGDDSIFQFSISLDNDISTNTRLDNARIPVLGKEDPWFRINGVRDPSGISLDSFIVANGVKRNSLNMDSLYNLGYQTVLINDENADLSALIPTFFSCTPREGSSVERLEVRVDNEIQQSGVSQQDFSNGGVAYNVLVNDYTKNYNVSMVKKTTGGAMLFVNGPAERSVYLDPTSDFKHDILIANLGDEELTNITVELTDAQHVKLDDYWTIGGDGNNSLAAFSSTTQTKNYGILNNLGKIRLLPDGEGDVSGTLTISAEGQEPVSIKLTGYASNPKITTESVAEGVKFVPYSQLITTNNMYDWNDVTFSLQSGKLPKGLELIGTSGEIYGVPQETGEFEIQIKATYSYSSLYSPSYQTYTLVIRENDDANVYNASDEGYGIQTALGVDQNGNHDYLVSTRGDQLFVSEGKYEEFMDLWLNGEKLEKGIDYTGESGSTRITIKSQTLENKASKTEKNTIAAEYRVDGKRDNDLKKTSQNFRYTVKNNSSRSSQPSAPATNTTSSAPSTNTTTSTPSASSTPSTSNTPSKTSTPSETVPVITNTVSQADRDSAANVQKEIAELPSVSDLTLADASKVKKAREAYEKLTDDQKNLVSNLAKLERAEKRIAKLRENKKIAAKADEVISKIPKNPTKKDVNKVKEGRDAYSYLTAAQKKYVKKHQTLRNAEIAVGMKVARDAKSSKAKRYKPNVLVNLMNDGTAVLRYVKMKKGYHTINIPRKLDVNGDTYTVTELSSKFIRNIVKVQGVTNIKLSNYVTIYKRGISGLDSKLQKKLTFTLTDNMTKAEQKALKAKLKKFGFEGKVICK